MKSLVKTGGGGVEGRVEGEVHVFRGIPFARPPLGLLRFGAPEPQEPWAGTLDATAFRASALQADSAGSPMNQLVRFEYEQTSEDCLVLNVWTPAPDAGRRPVLVWLHGGAFVFGSGSQPMYDGARMAARGDVVVVTVNYRLGVFGFLHGSTLCGPALETSGNQGVLDQVAALAWVRSEIASFGGDPDNVTVFGESAGSISLSALLAMPAASGLFAKAILQSGSANLVLSPERASEATRRVLADQGLEPQGAGRLRELSAVELQAAQDRATPRSEGVFYGPVLDGEVLPRDPFDAVRDGAARNVPVLIGTTRDEMKFFTALDPRTSGLDEAGLVKLVENLLANRGAERARAGRAIELYREARAARGEDVSPPELWYALGSDATFRHPAMRLAELQSAHAPVYAYLFDYASPIQGGVIGAGHLLDVPLVFDTWRHETIRGFTGEGPEVAALATRMQDAWIAFARSGDPSQPGLSWPRYEPDARTTMRLGLECGAEPAPREPERAFWDQVEGI